MRGDLSVVDPDLQIWGGEGREGRHPDSEIRGGPGLKKNFLALWASFWSKNKGGAGPLGPSPGSTTAFKGEWYN